MTGDPRDAMSRRVLDPVERLSEVIFGLIMALSFTGSLSVATAGHEEVRTMLIGAIGCNAAWGIVDGVMYVLTSLVQRRREYSEAVATGRPAPTVSVTARDLNGALACFLLVFLSTFPVALPFAIVAEPHRALRISNAVAIALLYVCGHQLGRWAGFRPVRAGLVFVAIGSALALITLALGG